MADYVDTTDDNGGVHTNSGIPNRAFHLAAIGDRRQRLGGRRQDLVRRAHLRDRRGHRLRRLRGRHGRRGAGGLADAAAVVRSAWAQVGVTAAAACGRRSVLDRRCWGARGCAGFWRVRPRGRARCAGPGRVTVVQVRRTGGFAGVRADRRDHAGRRPPHPRGRVAAGPDRLGRARAAASRSPTGSCTPSTLRGEQVDLGEQDLTPELQRLARLLLERPTGPPPQPSAPSVVDAVHLVLGGLGAGPDHQLVDVHVRRAG